MQTNPSVDPLALQAALFPPGLFFGITPVGTGPFGAFFQDALTAARASSPSLPETELSAIFAKPTPEQAPTTLDYSFLFGGAVALSGVHEHRDRAHRGRGACPFG